MNIIFWIAVGAFIGWNFPQPIWATLAQQWVISKWYNFTNKNKNNK